jgi:glyoxylase-like metal-dependent hydrolase (beta-lactamase superfamily II)
MDIITLPYGPLQSNMYLIQGESGFFIVDPSVSPDIVMRRCASVDLSKIKAILVTHAHYDHISSVFEWMKKCPDVQVFMSDVDVQLLSDPQSNCSFFTGSGSDLTFVSSDVSGLKQLSSSDDQFDIKAVPTPGHTSGSVTFDVTDKKDGTRALFTGDTIFAGSIGRTDFPTGDISEMYSSIDIIKKYPDELPIYPGHGPSSTVGYEKKTNPFFLGF